MESKKKFNRTLTRNLIISSIVWVSVILSISLVSGDSKKEIGYILLAAFFIEFLRITSSNKILKNDDKKG